MKPAATHEDLTRSEEVRGSSDRVFGLLFAVALALVGVAPLVHRRPIRWWSLALAAVLLVISSGRPRLLGPLNRLWLQAGLLLQRVVNPVVLGLMFFLTVTPIGLLMRWSGKDPLRLTFDPRARTYWIERRPPGPAPDTMRRQF